MSERLTSVLRNRGAAVRTIDGFNNTCAVTFLKETIEAKDFKGTEYENALKKQDRKKYKKEKKARRLGRKSFKKLRRKKFGRKWKNEELKISKPLWILVLSFLKKNKSFRFNNGHYKGRFIVRELQRYESGQIRRLHLKDKEGGSGGVIYIFPEMKNFRKLFKKLYIHLGNRKIYNWLIKR